jgi:hypothetical protein
MVGVPLAGTLAWERTCLPAKIARVNLRLGVHHDILNGVYSIS